MKGLELSRAFYETCGRPMLERDFPDLIPYLAAGLCGSGSECFGFDDEVSQDHDFEPGFCLFLPDETVIGRQRAFQLERAYAKLPRSFAGQERLLVQPAGGARHGVIRTADFFMDKAGTPDGQLSALDWLRLPDYALSEATNGALFDDQYGEVTRIRQALSVPPEDVRLKKLAGQLLLMAQSGQYNYLRCLRHGEAAAAQLAVHAFVTSGMQVIFLLNRVYMPYYKWAFRALRGLTKLSLNAELFEYLLTTDNEPAQAEEKAAAIESVCADVIAELRRQGLTEAVFGDLERHSYSVQDHIRDGAIRSLHILAAVS